jgi:hypothetical protein
MSKLVGVWNLVDSQNWEEYLKAMGKILEETLVCFSF